MELATILAIILVTAILVLFALRNVRLQTIYEYQYGLYYRGGKFQRVLGPGQYWYLLFYQSIYALDGRTQTVSIPGQELLTSDRVSVKISLAASYRIRDAERAFHATATYQVALYLFLQLRLRALLSAIPIDELLTKRNVLGEQIFQDCKNQAEEIGLDLLSVGIKDIMFPGELKNIFAQVVNAKNEGLAALERARGESAALRSLANAAHLLESNPNLFQLRLLQTLNATSGNTVVLNSTDGEIAVQSGKKERPRKK